MYAFDSTVITTHFPEMAIIELNSIPCVFWEGCHLDGANGNGNSGIGEG